MLWLYVLHTYIYIRTIHTVHIYVHKCIHQFILVGQTMPQDSKTVEAPSSLKNPWPRPQSLPLQSQPQRPTCIRERRDMGCWQVYFLSQICCNQKMWWMTSWILNLEWHTMNAESEFTRSTQFLFVWFIGDCVGHQKKHHRISKPKFRLWNTEAKSAKDPPKEAKEAKDGDKPAEKPDKPAVSKPTVQAPNHGLMTV